MLSTSMTFIKGLMVGNCACHGKLNILIKNQSGVNVTYNVPV